ncbi:MAG: hypothetical protein J6T47_03340 [Lachnospiraceae bacterium]|nr:hypothetical protein [Lachnospiraceae bacterium]
MIKRLTRIIAIILSLSLIMYLVPSVAFAVLTPNIKESETEFVQRAVEPKNVNEDALEASVETEDPAEFADAPAVETAEVQWFADAPMDGVIEIEDDIQVQAEEETIVSSDIEPAEEIEVIPETEVSAVTEETEAIPAIDETDETDETEAIEVIEEVSEAEAIEVIEELQKTAEEFDIVEEALQNDAAAETETIDETETQAEAAAEEPETEPTAAEPVPVGISASYIGSKYAGETITAGDLVVAVTLSDGSVITNPEGFNASPLNLTAQNNIIVSYKDVACKITFAAPERPVLKITAAPAPITAQRTTKLSVSDQIKIEYTGPTLVGSPIDPNMLLCYEEAGIDRYYAGTYSMTAKSDVFLPGNNPLTVNLNGQVYTLNVIAQEANPYGICSEGFDREDAVEVFRLQNEMRIAAGRKPLLWSEELYLIASARATWAVHENGIISHNGKMTTGENCFSGPIYGSPLSAAYKIDAYSNSKSHKNTILKAKYEYGAVSTYYGVSYSVFETSGWDSRLADAINTIRDTKGAYIPCE